MTTPPLLEGWRKTSLAQSCPLDPPDAVESSDQPQAWLKLTCLALVACVTLVCSLPQVGTCSSVIPVPLATLWRQAEAAAVVRVQALSSEKISSGAIYTRVTFDVLEELLPTAVPRPLVIEIPGGEVEGWVEVVSNVPAFRIGQLYVLLLTELPGQTWQPLQLELGVFSLSLGASKRHRSASEVLVVGSPGIEGGSSWTWDEFWYQARLARPFVKSPVLRREWLLPRAQAQFQFGRPLARLFESDLGQAVAFAIDPRGDLMLGREQSRAAVVQALDAWSSVDGTSLRLLDGGNADDLDTTCPDPRGQSFKVRFQDPDGVIPPPIDCRGILALTSYRSSASETKVIGGQEFSRIRCAVVSFADGWETCPNWTACNVAEIAVHELGHAIGLGHSSERVPEPNQRLRDATMYVQAHFDGRCATLRADDMDAVRFLYPVPPPLSILGDVILGAALVDTPYAHAFEVSSAVPPVRWQLGRSDYCGLQLDQEGVLYGSLPGCLCWSRTVGPFPTPPPTPYVFLTAEDTRCQAHTRFFTIPLEMPESGQATLPSCTPTTGPTLTGSWTPTPVAPCVPGTRTPTATVTQTVPMTSVPLPSGTATPAATSAASASPTTTPFVAITPGLTVTPSPLGTVPSNCVGDCDGSGVVTVDEIVRLVNVALGSLSLSRCQAGDRNGDGEVTVDEIVEAVRYLLEGCTG